MKKMINYDANGGRKVIGSNWKPKEIGRIETYF